MTKTYLNVPYAEKDTAKALGAKWDATQKKWYVPSKLDMSLFSRWYNQPLASAPIKSKTKPTPKLTTGTTTKPTDKNFVAYTGVAPPWD